MIPFEIVGKISDVENNRVRFVDPGNCGSAKGILDVEDGENSK